MSSPDTTVIRVSKDVKKQMHSFRLYNHGILMRISMLELTNTALREFMKKHTIKKQKRAGAGGRIVVPD